MPQNVQVELRNDSSITKILVNWETGFDGNSPINRYTVEVRTKKSSDGNLFFYLKVTIKIKRIKN